MSDLDPITQVHNAIWELLLAHPPFADAVKEGNRILFTGTSRGPIKDEVSTADLPEVRLVPAGAATQLQRTSNGSSLVKRFAIQVRTGEQRVDAGLYPLEWEIYRALADWTTVLLALKWSDYCFVKLCRPIGFAESLESNGITGWVSVWSCEVEMWFSTASLKYAEENT